MTKDQPDPVVDSVDAAEFRTIKATPASAGDHNVDQNQNQPTKNQPKSDNSDEMRRLLSTLERCRLKLDPPPPSAIAAQSPPQSQWEQGSKQIANDSGATTSDLPSTHELPQNVSQPAVSNLLVDHNSQSDAVQSSNNSSNNVEIVPYESEEQLADIMRLITKDLSEPYSIYTYRFFIHNWPSLCYLARDTATGEYVGAIVCKQDNPSPAVKTVVQQRCRRAGYIAMLAVDQAYRRLKLGSRLASTVIKAMQQSGCDEVVLETEISNAAALRLYERLGFVRAKRLFRYYLNGVDAYRLKLYFTDAPAYAAHDFEPVDAAS